MQMLITKVVRFRWGMERFEGRVNEHLAQGWTIESMNIEKKGFKIICYAILKK